MVAWMFVRKTALTLELQLDTLTVTGNGHRIEFRLTNSQGAEKLRRAIDLGLNPFEARYAISRICDELGSIDKLSAEEKGFLGAELWGFTDYKDQSYKK